MVQSLNLTGGDISSEYGSGGAIYVDNGVCKVTDAIICGNRAGGDGGGGIYVANAGNVTVTNTTFINNSVISGSENTIVQQGYCVATS